MISFPDALTLQKLISTIEATPPRPHHSTLLAAIGRVIPDNGFNHVLSLGGWHRVGGVLGADGNDLSRDLEGWVDAELAKFGEDFSLFVERYADAGLLVTRHTGRTHYFTAAYGPAAEDFFQLEVEELQEVLDRKLIDPERPPDDRQELVEPIHRAKVDAHPVGSPYYRFLRLVDVRQVVARQSAPPGGISPLARFMAEWSDSRASHSSHFCGHWIINGLDRYNPDASTLFSARPMSVHGRNLIPFQWDMTKSGAELGNQIRDFDRAASYPGAWYFHLVASDHVPESLGAALKGDLESGYDYLANKDLGLLNKLMASPYRVH